MSPQHQSPPQSHLKLLQHPFTAHPTGATIPHLRRKRRRKNCPETGQRRASRTALYPYRCVGRKGQTVFLSRDHAFRWKSGELTEYACGPATCAECITRTAAVGGTKNADYRSPHPTISSICSWNSGQSGWFRFSVDTAHSQTIHG